MPILNHYKPVGSTAEVDFKTVQRVHSTSKSHVNQVVLDNRRWESAAAFRLEQSPLVEYYVKNDHLGLNIPYEYDGVSHYYEPDFLIEMTDSATLVLEIKGYEDDHDRAKHEAARRWVSAVNNWGRLGRWKFDVCRNPQTLGQDLERMIKP